MKVSKNRGSEVSSKYASVHNKRPLYSGLCLGLSQYIVVYIVKNFTEATGFEPAISSLTGMHVRPLHHASTLR